MLATVKQLADYLNLSESRIRHYLGLKDAPNPKEIGRQIYRGRTPHKYEIEEFVKFYNDQMHQCRLRMESNWKNINYTGNRNL